MNLERAAGVARHRLRAALVDASRPLGLSLSELQVERLLEFLELLSRWNRTYNLTSIRDLPGMLTHHLVDCLAVIAPLRRHRASASTRTLLDVGSGGGLPGLVIAVMEPDLHVTCVDAVGKKAAFIRHAAATLGILNLSAEHARVEDLPAPPFDIVSARAYASLREFTSSTRPQLRDGGTWMAMKGKRPDAEIADLPTTVSVFHVEPLVVSRELGDRCLVWMQPTMIVTDRVSANSLEKRSFPRAP